MIAATVSALQIREVVGTGLPRAQRPQRVAIIGAGMAGLSAEVALVPGSGGIFEVGVDGEAVFSTKSHGRFPETRELRELLRDRIEGAPPPRH